MGENPDMRHRRTFPKEKNLKVKHSYTTSSIPTSICPEYSRPSGMPLAVRTSYLLSITNNPASSISKNRPSWANLSSRHNSI